MSKAIFLLIEHHPYMFTESARQKYDQDIKRRAENDFLEYEAERLKEIYQDYESEEAEESMSFASSFREHEALRRKRNVSLDLNDAEALVQFCAANSAMTLDEIASLIKSHAEVISFGMSYKLND